jgi:hypothetical protein
MLVPALAVSACSCGDDQLAVTISGPDLLTVTRGGVTRKVETGAQLTVPPANPSTFAFVYNTLEGSTSGDGLALTLSGRDPVTDELVILTVAVPVSLRQGDQYRIGETFTIEPTVDGDPRATGPYDLQRSDQAGAAFSVSTYTFPPATFTIGFRAVTSAGTILVAQREKGRVQLLLSLTFTDASGKTAVVTGKLQAVTQQLSTPCTT